LSKNSFQGHLNESDWLFVRCYCRKRWVIV